MLLSLLDRSVKLGVVVRNCIAGAAAVIGLALVVVLLRAPTPANESSTLQFVFLSDLKSQETSASALGKLWNESPDTAELSTARRETPFWLLSQSITPGANQTQSIELPSRHLTSVKYWYVDAAGSILESGEHSREAATGSIRPSRAGFVISAPQSLGELRVLLRLEAVGPARLSIASRSDQDIEASEKFFERSGGVLFGSLLMIAAFSFLISLLAREFTFFLFGGWVLASLRLSSYTAGWDMAWLGLSFIESLPTISRNLPLGCYALLTIALFWSIFKRDVTRLGSAKTLKILFALSLGLVLLAPLTPHKHFLPILWLVVIPSVTFLIWLTLRIFLNTGSSSAAWYGASWLATFSGALGDIAHATGLMTSKPTLANSLAASVAAALLAGIAIAQRLNSERSGRVQAQKEALQALDEIKEVYEGMPIGLFSLDAAGSLRIFNPAFSAMFELRSGSSKRIAGAHIDLVLGHGTWCRLKDATEATITSDIEIHIETKVDTPERWFLARVTSKEGAIEGSMQDITLRKQAEAKLKHLVDHDSLTGLRNRRGLDDAMDEAQRLASEGVPCAIAQLSLDRFKLINDLYGHRVGDVMLQQTALRLMQAVRGRDHVARIADSFVVIFLDCPDFATVGLSERLREAVSELPFELEGKRLDMTASVGVVGFDPKMDLVDTLAAAGRACAEAKSRGRNCVVQLDDNDSRLKTHLEELKVVADLKRKIHTDRYFLDFQPIVALQAPHSSLNYEVLLRMRDENGGVIQPGRFIGAAERNGLMSEIDRWVLRSTLEWLDLHAAHRDRLSFATINISGASLNDARFVDDAFAMIADHPMAMPKLCFEITESVALNDINSTRRFIDRVKQYGSKLALDDFGAGYTSFNYLKEIPADFIKIDGSFVRDINLNPANYSITRTIVDLTHELGMRSIAEWAETPDTVATLVELGVDYGQGYGLARAMDKNLVTAAASCGDLVRDERVLAIMAAGPAYAGITASGGAAVR